MREGDDVVALTIGVLEGMIRDHDNVVIGLNTIDGSANGGRFLILCSCIGN